MIGRISSLAVGMAVLLSASDTLAQAAAVAATGSTFGTAGTLALSADRMFGFAHTTFKSETQNPPPVGTITSTISVDSISLLGRTSFGTSNLSGGLIVASPYSAPRLGIDVFPIDNLSVGGSLTYIGGSAEVEAERAGTTQTIDLGSASGFLIAPRVGFGMMFNEFIGIWPRGGITFFTASSEDKDQLGNVTSEDSVNGFAFTVEVPLILSPADHVGITLGPTLDFPLSGKTKNDPTDPALPTTENDLKITEIGVNAGLVAWF